MLLSSPPFPSQEKEELDQGKDMLLGTSASMRLQMLRSSVSGLPTRSKGKHNVAVFIIPFQEGDTGVLLPVAHGLPKDGSLAAYRKQREVQS